MKRYAFAVETDTSGVFEVFEMANMPDTLKDINDSWTAGIASGNTSLVHVAGVESVAVGDTYSKGSFKSNGGTKLATLSDDVEVFALVGNSKVFGFISVEANTFMSEKYLAAVQGKTTILDVTDKPEVILGALWDGTSVVSA